MENVKYGQACAGELKSRNTDFPFMRNFSILNWERPNTRLLTRNTYRIYFVMQIIRHECIKLSLDAVVVVRGYFFIIF
jgi:hypothetical protein